MTTKRNSLWVEIPDNSSRKQNEEKEEEQSCRNTLFLGVLDEEDNTTTRNRKHNSFRRQYSDMGENYHRIHKDKEGKLIDLRLLMLLEYFRELSVRKIEVLKKIFPGVKDEFGDFFKKIGVVLSRSRSGGSRGKTLQRSLSIGSSSEMRMERFKVTTPDLVNLPPGGAAAVDGGGKPAGSTKK